MLVRELIKKLEKCDPDAVVLLENDSLYEDGAYKATSVESYEDGIVYVATDHEELVEEY